jgi:hypothetical protein
MFSKAWCADPARAIWRGSFAASLGAARGETPKSATAAAEALKGPLRQ